MYISHLFIGSSSDECDIHAASTFGLLGIMFLGTWVVQIPYFTPLRNILYIYLMNLHIFLYWHIILYTHHHAKVLTCDFPHHLHCLSSDNFEQGFVSLVRLLSSSPSFSLFLSHILEGPLETQECSIALLSSFGSRWVLFLNLHGAGCLPR